MQTMAGSGNDTPQPTKLPAETLASFNSELKPRAMQEDLGKPVEELFRSFEERRVTCDHTSMALASTTLSS